MRRIANMRFNRPVAILTLLLLLVPGSVRADCDWPADSRSDTLSGLATQALERGDVVDALAGFLEALELIEDGSSELSGYGRQQVSLGLVEIALLTDDSDLLEEWGAEAICNSYTFEQRRRFMDAYGKLLLNEGFSGSVRAFVPLREPKHPDLEAACLGIGINPVNVLE